MSKPFPSGAASLFSAMACGRETGPAGKSDWSNMRGFKEKSFAERQSSSAGAKQAMLQRFRARPAADDPEVMAQRAARQALVAAREQRIAERDAARRAAQAQAAAEEAERVARERQEAAERIEREAAEALALEAQRKAERDARYAARKARKRK